MGALEAPQDRHGQEHRMGTSRAEQTDRDHGGAGSSGGQGGAGSSGGHGQDTVIKMFLWARQDAALLALLAVTCGLDPRG